MYDLLNILICQELSDLVRYRFRQELSPWAVKLNSRDWFLLVISLDFLGSNGKISCEPG